MVVHEMGSFVVMLPALFVDNVGLDHCHLDLLRATSPISLFHSREQTLVLKDNVHKSQQPSLGTSAMFFHSLGNALSDSPQPLLYGPKDGNDFAPGGPPHLQRVVVHVLLLHLDDLLDKQQKLVAQRQGDLKVRLVGTGRLGDRHRPRESPQDAKGAGVVLFAAALPAWCALDLDSLQRNVLVNVKVDLLGRFSAIVENVKHVVHQPESGVVPVDGAVPRAYRGRRALALVGL
mmetsp:Transcript_26125/g.61329  ORF Transcript_26125/g.61329 Transcript_26125/m.61329 type:complete len:233 (+) Transcript_26125:1912-2610(+)